MDKYKLFCRVDGKVTGPYSKAEFRARLKANQIPALAELAKSPDGPWEPLSAVLMRSSRKKTIAATALPPPSTPPIAEFVAFVPTSQQPVYDPETDSSFLTPPPLPPSRSSTPHENSLILANVPQSSATRDNWSKNDAEVVYETSVARSFYSQHEEYSADWFIDRIKFIIGGNDLRLPSSRIEAQGAIRLMKSELGMLKKMVNQVMSEIRNQCMDRTANVGIGIGSLVASLFVKRNILGKINQLNRSMIRNQKRSMLEPFENVKSLIDRIRHELDVAKHQLDVGE